MIEKVNPSHPDKQVDRLCGAIVDYCYTQQEKPQVAVEALVGHGLCTVIVESSVKITSKIVKPIVNRIFGEGLTLKLISVPQDEHLADNQKSTEVHAGDNGIFKGVPLSKEEIELTDISQWIYSKYHTDGKYILDEENNKLIICQSCCDSKELEKELKERYPQYEIVVNPLGDWTGGTSVDSGAVNRKLGSDMYRSVSGGGLHGKDVDSKCDTSCNIYAWMMAQKTGKPYEFYCAIGDTEMSNGVSIADVVKFSKKYINEIGGYEALAEWGLW